MSQLFITQYLNELHRLRKISGTNRETVVREAFKDLLKSWGKTRELQFIAEYPMVTAAKNQISLDGALLHSLRVPLGYWEAKDDEDDLDKEIIKKFRKGYPRDNIIFEDTTYAVLIQNGAEAVRCRMDEPELLEKLLKLFFAYERREIAEFRKAVEQFKTDLPAVLAALRDMIATAEAANADFCNALRKFLKHAKDTINPAVTEADVREMLIQHVLTEEIFAKVFDESDFHRQNNVAKELYALEAEFFTGAVKKNTLKDLEPYYAAIRAAAALISTHHEKQAFLKVIYENFYKVYNKKAADRLGVIYTPNEIVRFMVESADWLCQKHFGKSLIDKNVEILDPAAGTGTFITELLEHFRGQPKKLPYKYKEELHANEVAILPYYVANLNIEATYAAITDTYEEFKNLCFVDTLDNVAGLGKFSGYQEDMFGAMSEENVERIKRQNKRKISVIIGNPPYNANQQNENDNNKNRTYPRIDERIKATYIKESTAQKTKLYDMYARFFRWASDRIKDDGIIAFVSNSSFIDSRTFDGFRKVVARDFSDIWVIDLKGNARTSGERRRQEGGNIFHDQIRVGVAVYFCVRNPKLQGCSIHYEAVRDYAKSDEKRGFLTSKRLSERPFELIKPDAEGNWLGQTDNDFGSLIPVATKGTKAAKTPAQERAIFKLLSNGIVSARDEWTTGFSSAEVAKKVKTFCQIYLAEQARWLTSSERKAATTKQKRVIALRNFVSREIKWTEELEAHLNKGTALKFSTTFLKVGADRPFILLSTYFARVITHRVYQQHLIFPIGEEWNNTAIGFSGVASSKPFQSLAVNTVPSFDLLEKTQFVPRYRYEHGKARLDNITDWALEQFKSHYEGGASPAPREGRRAITKDAIFHYVYGVLHDPAYREKYAQDLKREFPRIPFYPNFWRWAGWGEALMQLHIGFESVEPWPLARNDTKDEKAAAAGLAPKAILRADKEHGIVVIDSETRLSGVPRKAWDYRLGNLSGLEWILDQYKERTPTDPTIRDKFNTYRFANYKEKVIDLLARVTCMSVETMKIVEAMQAEKR